MYITQLPTVRILMTFTYRRPAVIMAEVTTVFKGVDESQISGVVENFLFKNAGIVSHSV